jgi:hypothetical protein
MVYIQTPIVVLDAMCIVSVNDNSCGVYRKQRSGPNQSTEVEPPANG